jgi:hypothetical protein
MPSLFDRPVNKSNALRNGALSYALERKPTLGERLRAFAKVAGEDESAEYFGPNDFRWAETVTDSSRPTIYINDKKFKDAGAGDYRDKMVTLETLHLLDEVDPKRHKEIYDAAMGDPSYQDWAKESYKYSKADPAMNETRSFDDWHRQSRFDQVMGGYLMAGDKDIPTAKNWSRDHGRYGQPLLEQLGKLEKELFPGGYPKK